MFITRGLLFFLAHCFIVSLGDTLWGQNIRVEASFQPNSISVSSVSTYKLVIHGTQQNPQGKRPTVEGLQISNNPRSLRSANFINGVPSVRVELSFQVKPQRVGSFTIPSWILVAEGQTIPVPPATLKVLAPTQKEKQAQEDLRQASFLEFDLPKSYFYEGETVLGKLTLFVWDRLPVTRIENAPVKIGDSFSSNSLSKWHEEKRNVSKFSKIYSTFSWPISLTASMAGTKEISFTVNLRVRVNSRSKSPFSSPFFNDPFFGFGREESLAVKLPTKVIEVKPLPTKNRPPTFSGAIGSFRSSYYVSKEKVNVGDPVQLTFSLEGKGNFSAIPAPVIQSNKNFKVSSPVFLFDGDKTMKFEGVQKFEYILTPLRQGKLEVPSVTFSYFDPELGSYLTTPVDKSMINVEPGEQWTQVLPNNPNPISESKSPSISSRDLFQTASNPGQWKDSLQANAVDASNWFWSLQLIPFSGVCALCFLGWKKRNSTHEDLRIKKSNLTRRLNQSADHLEAKEFFRAFKDLLRTQINLKDRNCNAFALSTKELLEYLIENGKGNEVVNQIEEMLNLSDNLEFADVKAGRLDFKELKAKVASILKKLS